MLAVSAQPGYGDHVLALTQGGQDGANAAVGDDEVGVVKEPIEFTAGAVRESPTSLAEISTRTVLDDQFVVVQAAGRSDGVYGLEEPVEGHGVDTDSH